MQAQATQTVPLGDALQRIVAQIYNDSNKLLLNLKSQDPELRTTELRAFLANTKAKLLQTLCLVRWLGQPNVVNLFHSLVQFNMCMANMDEVMARNLDEMFFVHGSLYPMRSFQHECKIARSIISADDYLGLPLAIRTAGRKPLPVVIPKDSLHAKLNIYIRAKIAIIDPIPRGRSYICYVKAGSLFISLENVFNLQLSLRSLRRDAAWLVQRFSCPRRFDRSFTDSEVDIENDMQKLSKCLEVCAESSESLRQLLEVCANISNKLQLRSLYDFLRDREFESFNNCSEVKLVEDKDYLALHVYFWRSEFTK
jgi:hypothetical protein